MKRTFNRLGTVGSLGIACLLAISSWGNWWQLAYVVVQMVVLGTLNILVTSKLIPRIGVSATESWRAALNLTGALAAAHILHWPLASWLYLPFLCVLIDGRDRSAANVRLSLVVGVWNGCAFASGASFEMAASFTGIGVFSFFVAASRISIIEELLGAREGQNAALAAAHEELKKIHVQARAQDKLAGLGMLAAGIAHEINNPMSYVTSNLRGLQEDLMVAPDLTPALIEQRDDVLKDTLDGVRRVNSIVGDLRRFASGGTENPVDFDLREELEAAARIVRPQLKDRQSIRIDVPESLMMRGMPRQLGQVFVNLLVNAVQALSETGEVIARGRTDGANIEVFVTDDGSGIREDVLAKLFQPFFTTKEVGTATGLGLAVALGIVHAHCGTIEVDSAVGRGSTFAVNLPVRAP